MAKMRLKTMYRDRFVTLKVSKNPPAYYLRMGPAANCLPVTDDKKILVMHEYKATTKKWVWGFPGGMIEPGETAAVAAKRETEEELGLRVGKTVKICEVKTHFPDTSVTFFLGYDLRKVQAKNWAEEKIGMVKKVSADQLFKLALDGKISDPRAVVAILHLQKLLKSGRIRL